MVSNFSQSLKFGQAGESEIATWLRSRGCTVLPAYEKIFDFGKGPVIYQPSRRLISPDFLIWRGLEACWIEAKRKTAFTWYRKTGTFQTGIDERHYRDYLVVDEETPWPVWLLFLHDGGQAKDSPPSPQGLFGNKLCYLRDHVDHRDPAGGNGGRPMVYWNIGALKKLTEQADGIDASSLSPPVRKPPHKATMPVDDDPELSWGKYD